jgi:hypothetical protein
MGLEMSAEFRRAKCYVAGIRISLAKLSPEYMDRMSNRRGALQCRFLENASSSLLILFRP